MYPGQYYTFSAAPSLLQLCSGSGEGSEAIVACDTGAARDLLLLGEIMSPPFIAADVCCGPKKVPPDASTLCTATASLSSLQPEHGMCRVWGQGVGAKQGMGR